MNQTFVEMGASIPLMHSGSVVRHALPKLAPQMLTHESKERPADTPSSADTEADVFDRIGLLSLLYLEF